MNINYIWDISTGYSTRAGKYKTKLQNKFIEKCLKNSKNLRILDIGGGSGRFALPLSNNHFVTVIDPNKEALELLRSRDKEQKIKFISDRFENVNLSEKFDVVILIEVMNTFDDIKSILEKVSILLNKNGFVLFTDLNKTSIKFLYRKFMKHTHYPGVASYNDYKKLISETGYKIINVEGYNWIPLRVNSNSKCVNFFAMIEKILNLKQITRFSPEIMFWIKKI